MSVKEFQSNVSQDVSSGKEKKHLRQRDFEDRLTILLKLASLEEVSQAEAFELPGPPPALSDASLEQGDPSAPGVTSRVERREEQNRRTVAVFRAFQQLSKRRRDQVAAAITIDGTVFEFRESEDADVSPNGLCSEFTGSRWSCEGCSRVWRMCLVSPIHMVQRSPAPPAE